MFLKRWLALSRTRLFVAVVVPASIGAALAFADGFFSWGYFVLIVFGLVMAEMTNLFLGDWASYRGVNLSGDKATPPPILEGSPTLPELLLPLEHTIHAAIGCALPASAALIYFVWELGWPILALMTFAAVAGAFYVTPPFRHAYFSTALLPPVIVFGTYYVLSGSLKWQSFLPALPMSFAAAGVIYTYRVVYNQQGRARFEARRTYIKVFYALCYSVLLAAALLGLVSPWALLGLLTLPLTYVIERVAQTDRSHYLAATSLGVLLHSATGMLIALGYLISGSL